MIRALGTLLVVQIHDENLHFIISSTFNDSCGTGKQNIAHTFFEKSLPFDIRLILLTSLSYEVKQGSIRIEISIERR
jgi:hypothetical protein